MVLDRGGIRGWGKGVWAGRGSTSEEGKAGGGKVVFWHMIG